jgi:2-polyprenyl-3-methyl-5-hydroxy-6-metoxy-1,4-benzoquinol methylase
MGSETPCALWGKRPWMPEGHYTLAGCRTCGTLYVDSDVTEEYLNSLQAEYVPDLVRSDAYETMRSKELEWNWLTIRRIRSPKAGDKLLDFGSSWGHFGAFAQNDGVEPNGVELIPQAIEYSLKLWGEKGRVHCGPLDTAPFTLGEFQYITAFETLEHLRDPIRIMSQLKPLLADDGIITFSVPSASYFRFKYWIYRKQPLGAILRRRLPGNMQGGRVLCHNHINTFSTDSARRMLIRGGFDPVYVASVGWHGGRIGTVLKLMGDVVWTTTGGKTAFAPSIFVVGRKG